MLSPKLRRQGWPPSMPALIVAMILSLLVGQLKNPGLITAVMVLTYGVILLGVVANLVLLALVMAIRHLVLRLMR